MSFELANVKRRSGLPDSLDLALNLPQTFDEMTLPRLR